MDGIRVSTPGAIKARPAKDNLEERYEVFRAAG
jgi:hypothetical protein